MKAQIDIKHPSGKSLEGFPFVYNEDYNIVSNILHSAAEQFYQSHMEYLNGKLMKFNHKLHPGDKITIEILP